MGYAKYARAASRNSSLVDRTSQNYQISGDIGLRLVRTVPSQIYTPPTF
jgi:hypothetical protein